MNTIITVANIKGGVAKSTTAWAVSSLLARTFKVLAIDMDPQGSLSLALIDEVPANSHDIFARGVPIKEAVVPALPQYGPTLSVLSASPSLSGLDAEMAGKIDRQYIIADRIEEFDSFDFVVIDTPGSSGLLTSAALCAADHCLTPCCCDDACFSQLSAFKQMLEVIQRRLNPRLKWLPLLAVLHERWQLMDRAILDAMKIAYPVFEQVIPKRVALRDQMARQQPCDLPEFEVMTQQLLQEIRR